MSLSSYNIFPWSFERRARGVHFFFLRLPQNNHVELQGVQVFLQIA